jgi:hypothetical protein
LDNNDDEDIDQSYRDCKRLRRETNITVVGEENRQ